MAMAMLKRTMGNLHQPTPDEISPEILLRDFEGTNSGTLFRASYR